MGDSSGLKRRADGSYALSSYLDEGEEPYTGTVDGVGPGNDGSSSGGGSGGSGGGLGQQEVQSLIDIALGFQMSSEEVQSLIGNALTAFVPKWAPGTVYHVGDQVIDPDNDVVSSMLDFTSGSTFSPNNWQHSSTYATEATIDAVFAQLPTSGGGNMTFLGEYSDQGDGTEFLLGDVVTASGLLLICETPYNASQVPALASVGTVAIPYPRAGTQIVIPAGAEADDLVLLSICTFLPGGPHVPPLFGTSVKSGSVGGSGVDVYSYTLNGMDIDNGVLVLPVHGSDGAATLSVFRNAAVDTAHTSLTTTLTAPSTTPSAAGLIYHFAVDGANADAHVVGTQAQLSGVVTADISGIIGLATGYEAYTSGTTTPRLWSFTAGYSGSQLAGLVPLVPAAAAGVVDMTKWKVLSTVGLFADAVQALIGQALAALPAPALDNMDFRGVYDGGIAYALNDVVTDSGRLLRCKTAHTSGGVATLVGATAAEFGSDNRTIALPAGAAVDDTALVSLIVQDADTGMTQGVQLFRQIPSVGPLSVRIYSYTLTADDIAAGSITMGGTASAANGMTLTLFHGPVGFDTAHDGFAAGTFTEPSVTPAAAGYLYHFSRTYSGNSSTASLPSSVDVVSGGGNLFMASGLEATQAGVASTPRTWEWSTGGSGGGHACAGVLPLSLGGPDLTKWDVLSAS